MGDHRIKWSSYCTLNLQKGFSIVNSIGWAVVLKKPLPTPKKACILLNLAKIASRSSSNIFGTDIADKMIEISLGSGGALPNVVGPFWLRDVPVMKKSHRDDLNIHVDFLKFS